MTPTADAVFAGHPTQAEVKAVVSNHSTVSLATMLGDTNKPCKPATVRDPYSDKAMKKASGSSVSRCRPAAPRSAAR